MKTKKILSKSPQETMRLAQQTARLLKPADILCLFGDLGSGKTTFVKGLAKGLKILDKKVNSPTFVLMNVYEGQLPLYHFDLYRLGDTAGIRALGYEEFLYGEGVSVIEWAERLGELMPQECLRVEFTHPSKGEGRGIRVTAVGRRYEQMIQQLSFEL